MIPNLNIQSLLEEKLQKALSLLREDVILEEGFISEVAFKRVVRAGKIVRKVVKKKGYRTVRKGGSVKFVRQTAKDKRIRRKAARKAWRKGRAARVSKSKRTIRKSKARMNTLYGSKKGK